MGKETDTEIEERLARTPDKGLCAIYLAAEDGEHLTREQELALGEMERRGVDW